MDKSIKGIYLDMWIVQRIKEVTDSISITVGGLVENIVKYTRENPGFIRIGEISPYNGLEKKRVSISITDSIYSECVQSAKKLSLSVNLYFCILIYSFLRAPEQVQKDILLVNYVYRPIEGIE